jgi:hypothetical protein
MLAFILKVLAKRQKGNPAITKLSSTILYARAHSHRVK